MPSDRLGATEPPGTPPPDEGRFSEELLMERPAFRERNAERSSVPTMTFVGHARLPQSLARTDPGVVCIELEVDPASAEVVGMASQAVMPRGELLLREVLLGYDLGRGVDDALREIQRRYIGAPQKAICSAIASAYEAYLRSRGEGAAASHERSHALLHARPSRDVHSSP